MHVVVEKFLGLSEALTIINQSNKTYEKQFGMSANGDRGAGPT